jgi:hypothetical protein
MEKPSRVFISAFSDLPATANKLHGDLNSLVIADSLQCLQNTAQEEGKAERFGKENLHRDLKQNLMLHQNVMPTAF